MTCYSSNAGPPPPCQLTCFHASFFPFCPFCWPPLFLPFSRHIFATFPPRKVLCSVEQRAQCRAWRGAVPGWISPQSSGRKFLPEICVKKGQRATLWAREMGTICPWAFFPLFYSSFGPNLSQSMQRGQLWCCDAFPSFRVVLRLGTPNPPFVLFGAENGLFRLPIHYVLKGK